MNIPQETSDKIQELQIIEQNIQEFLIQKQTVQIELNEVLNAINEIQKTTGEVYKLVSGIMIKSNKNDLFKELNEKKKLLELRISSIEKQESLLEKKINSIKKDITGSVREKTKSSENQ